MCEIDSNILSTIGLCKEELENAIVSNCGHPKATLIQISTAESSSLQGSGYLSAIFPVLLKWSGEGADSLPASVIVKKPSAAGLNSENGEYSIDMGMDNFLPVAHENECKAYEILAGVKDISIAKVYYSRVFSNEQGGLIIMDYLCNAQHWNLGKGATELQIKAMLKCLALLHANIYAREDDTWKSGIHFEREMLEKSCEALPRDLLPILEEIGGQRMKDALKKVPEDGMVKCAAMAAEAFTNLAQIVGLVSIGVSGNYRRENIDSLLEFYYENLTQALSKTGKKAPFTLNQLKTAYKKTLELGLFLACFCVPLFVTTRVVTEKSGINFF